MSDDVPSHEKSPRGRGPAQPSLQDRYAPYGICFGCGPANPRGLRIKSHPRGDEVVADWLPETHHQAFPGMLNGGIVGALLDCHGNWTAAWHLMQRRGLDQPPATVTAEYSIKLLRPVPAAGPVRLRARVKDASDRKAVVEGELEAGGEVCARMHGVFVAVPPDHPAFGRWSEQAHA